MVRFIKGGLKWLAGWLVLYVAVSKALYEHMQVNNFIGRINHNANVVSNTLSDFQDYTKHEYSHDLPAYSWVAIIS